MGSHEAVKRQLDSERPHIPVVNMRVLLDTNIFVYMATAPDYLSRDALAILYDTDTVLCMSAESVRELIVAYRNKGLCSKRWKTAEEMVAAIEDEFYIQILPLKKEHMTTYARMEINCPCHHRAPAAHFERHALPVLPQSRT